jgi:hypothetical protein
LVLTERIINGFYFEFGLHDENTILIGAFVTPTKPNIGSSLLGNQELRLEALKRMFQRLNELREYSVKGFRKPEEVKAQGSGFLATAFRGGISRKDGSRITTDEVVRLIAENLSSPA